MIKLNILRNRPLLNNNGGRDCLEIQDVVTSKRIVVSESASVKIFQKLT